MIENSTRVVFMGSPAFSVPILEGLIHSYPVVGVVTQPDRPKGRGRKLSPPPVKVTAEAYGIPVIQPERLRRDAEAFDQIVTWAPDVIVVAAFGQIVKANVLDLPRFGCVNVHTSLLPRWRGASPIQAALLHGDRETGVTIMKMDAGIDTGPILAQEKLTIPDQINAEELEVLLSHLGADLLLRTLPDYLSGNLVPQPQDDAHATKASLLNKQDGLLDFTQRAEELVWKVRAFNPWPGAFMPFDGQNMKVHQAHCSTELNPAEPGTLNVIGNLPAVATSDGWLVLDEVQVPGKKPMDAAIFLRGCRNWMENS
ncbi:MAG: methionyl-tRNA formyltransferase [Anaerolineaceae bacterium]|nr:methionyl-tRNA formyltransferase [Anaerolineaceae bacterium]